MGAMTALRFAFESSERLRTLLIAGIDVEREPRASVSRRLMDPERVDRDEAAWAAQLERRHGPVQGAGAWRRLLPAIARDVAEQPLLSPADLSRVRVPTLYAVGDRDVFVPVGHAVALYRQLPDARLFVAPDCDHQVMVTRPGLFNEAALAFYRSTEAIARARAEGNPPPDRTTLRGPNRAPVPTSLGGDD
jgi:pimeloyl-ACP methyl ester carboxylesterase